ncbi:MAG TPA: hypothetical protein VFL76_10410 [Edaphocola sp.]|nr:hypothetical protein [Edaphocola sp.]
MKKLIFILLLLLGVVSAYTQTLPMNAPAADSTRFSAVSSQLLQAMLSGQTDSARIIKHHGRWKTFWEKRVANNASSDQAIFGKAVEALDDYMRTSSQCLGTFGQYRGDWHCMGPFINYYGENEDHAGRTISVWVDPANPDYILTGAATGGLWKTTDGGQNWANITDALQNSPTIPGTMGVTDIAVSPSDKNIIYLATGNSKGALTVSFWDGRYGLGIAYSLDGGQSWQMDMDFRNVSGAGSTDGWVYQADIIKLAYSPSTGKLYAMMPHKVLMKASQAAGWQDITPSAIQNMPGALTLSDFECTHNPAGKIVFSTMGVNDEHYLFIYNESTGQWTSRTFQFNPGATNPDAQGIWDMAINGVDDIYLLVQVKTEHEYKIYKTGLALNSPLTLKNNDLWASAPSSYSSNWNGHLILTMRKIVASQVNPNVIYLVNTSGSAPFLHKSTDGGQTLSYINCTHADGRALLLYQGGGSSPSGNDDIIYACEDGGISLKPAGSNTFHSLSGNGLTINQFLSISTNPADDGMAVAGAIDNGNFSYMEGRQSPWEPTNYSADGMIDVFANNGEPRAYTQFQSKMSNEFFYDQQNHSVTAGSQVIGKTPDEFAAAKWERPLHFDASNTARYGSHFIWERQLSDPTDYWESALAGEPKPSITTQNTPSNNDLLTGYKLPVQFILSEQYPDIGYIAYYNVNWNGNAQTNDLIGNLFVSQTLTTTHSWVNISPPEVTFGPITDIVIDPAHPNRIWVSYGATNPAEIGTSPTLRTRRVLYSDNYGLNDSWIDVSKGLPPMPIIQLLYVPGSDDILFAATDVGVFRWNKATAQWECFNDGMPRQIITGLDYIPCSGKLRVSTYGRGIWETTILADQSDYLPGETTVISANTTWNSSKTITGGIRVKTGATLTISGTSTTVYMPRRAVITVEPGAKLVVDGATITNECHDCEWGGIALTGNQNQPPLPQYQGSLVLKNSATLENAYIAINNYSWDNGAQGGGIIDATNSTIRNCWRAVALNGYGNYSYRYNSTTSKCLFDHMTFEVNNAEMYDVHGAPDYFTSFDTKGGVEITNSTFTNTISTATIPENKRGRGIYTLATGLKVQNCTFSGLNEGVHCEGYASLPTRIVSVFLSDFSNINHGITLSGTAYANIKGNTIHDMVLNAYDLSGAYGIYLNHSKGAYVGCHNAIDGTFGGTHNSRYGIIVNDSRKNATTVIDNTITNTYVGTQTQKMNVALNIFCNDYENNDYAWAINPQSASSWFNDQGTGCQPTDIRAGNIFKNNQKDILSYLSSSWNYYAGNGSAYEIPAWWSGVMTLNQCTTSANSQCNDLYSCIYDWSSTTQGEALSQYSDLENDGFKMRADAVRLYGHIIRGFNYLDEEPQLQSFLESENDDRSRKLLIPLYINQGLYDQATNTIRLLSLPEAERTGYNNYYNLLINLRQSGRQPDSLTSSELTMVETLAADTLEVSPYAKGYLDWWYKQTWENPIEPLPQSRGTGQAIEPETPGHVATRLGNAVPNPTSSKTAVDVYIGSRDAMKHPVLIIHNAMGKEMYRHPLAAGQNHIEVNTGTWEPGIYVYNLLLNNAVSASKKLSVTR